jgi:mono/diheme cytochrome c family protein
MTMEGRTRAPARALVWILAAVALVETVWLAYPAVRARVFSLEESAPVRGQRLAVTLGCFACHGPGGVGGVKNPGSEEQSVPAFTEQTQMMYVKNTDDLREYILDGAPRRKRDDPDYRAQMEAAAVRMPAYRPFVTAGQVEDLVAYLRASSGQILPDEERAARGAELAIEYSCAACHGPLGAGGIENPGSLKGYVPSFWGADFDELVRDDDELRTWIAEGEIKRIAEHPIGGRFLRGQVLKMPAYGRFLAPADLDALVAWVRWVRAGTWRPLLR